MGNALFQETEILQLINLAKMFLGPGKTEFAKGTFHGIDVALYVSKDYVKDRFLVFALVSVPLGLYFIAI